uniref:G_PROTEIN_RECEP_F1_2 domain-containing protein n=1 Tax=Meloidogyne hapla TaxID=6305 RepID=A0A1I8B8J7_MELHA
MSQNKIIIKNIDVNQMFEATTNFNQEQLNTKNINNNEIIISTIDCDAEMTPPPLNDLSQIIYSVLMPIVCLLGVMGAIICVFIFTRRQMRSSLSIYLAALSSFDFVLLLCAAIIYPSMNMCLQEGNRGPICHFFWRTSLATYPLSLMAQTASVWTVIAITVDRYLAVRYPLHMRAWLVY